MVNPNEAVGTALEEKLAVVSRKWEDEDVGHIARPKPQEKVAIELPFREWDRIADCLEHYRDILGEAGARVAAMRNVDRAFGNLEVAYNKTTGRWDLG